ncbi:MAG: hypothetical protein EHM47_09805 [Ignavibacteriales bacterium]|nr:MAG: hypothetical protein EHM47_09805 [Ignavibacteriales bacterium]
MDNNRNKFPRQLTSNENMLLLSVLPENKIGYKSYRDKINTLLVTGSGRFGGGNFILGKEGTISDLSFPSSPVFALGTNEYKECKIDITIHEEIDNEIEYDISVRNQDSIPEILTEIRKWNYSGWNPGDKAPNDNSLVREIIILENKYLLAIAPQHKKIWLHEFETGVNHLIPVTNFYNELMRVSEIRDTSVALKPASFFDNHIKFIDKQLMLAFFSYSRYLRKFNIQNPVTINSVQPKRKIFFSIFRKD